MSSSKMRAAIGAVCGGALLATLPLSAFAYGLDGLFGGRPDPNGVMTLAVPLQTEETPHRAQSVLDHPRPDYDPLPIHLGSFLVTPGIEAGYAYNSNIFDTPAKVGDSVIAVDPRITVASDWGRHFLSLTALGDFAFYQQYPSQNLNNTVVQADGRFDIASQTWLAGSAGYQKQNVPRSSLDNNAGSDPTTFNLYTASVSAFRGVGLVHAETNYAFNRFDYAASQNEDAGVASLSAFNRDENNFGGKISYVVSEDFKPYVNAQFNTRSYDSTATRNSQGYRADVGADWDLGGVTSIGIYTGYLWQDYSSFGADPVDSGIDFGGKMTWNVTALTTVVLDANRSVEEALIEDYNSFLATSGSVTVTHELRRNIILEADASYGKDAYQGFSKRNDDVESAGGGTRYLINRNLYADLDYSWNHRSSSVEGQGYVDHLVVAKLGLQF